ncbi:MAG: hypothetical protein JNL21_24135 [Myxococcales bacterium]|nr:hypothetical protein [Myxococcales bacterium]
MSQRLEPLPELAQRLLDAERPVPALDPELRERMNARIAGSLGFDDGAAAASVTVGASAALGEAARAASTAGTTSVLAATIQSKIVITMLVFGVGAGAGAGVHAVATSHEPAPSASVTFVTTGGPAPATTVAPRAPVPPAPTAEPTASASVEAPVIASPSYSTASPLQRERSLIDTARMAILRGDRAAALAALDAHAREFPNGQHAADRVALEKRARALGDR